MDEVIEKILNDAIKQVSGFGWADQSFILGEVSEKLVDYSHTCLINEYGMNEEECENGV